MISNFMAILLQHLCIKLGVATGRDLAQACRDHYSTATVWFLWILCEIAIAACDLAEVVGSAIAPATSLWHSAGLGMHHHRAGCAGRALSAKQRISLYRSIVITLIATIGACFAAELIFSKPSFIGIALGFVPGPHIVANQQHALYQHWYHWRDRHAA